MNQREPGDDASGVRSYVPAAPAKRQVLSFEARYQHEGLLIMTASRALRPQVSSTSVASTLGN